MWEFEIEVDKDTNDCEEGSERHEGFRSMIHLTLMKNEEKWRKMHQQG